MQQKQKPATAAGRDTVALIWRHHVARAPQTNTLTKESFPNAHCVEPATVRWLVSTVNELVLACKLDWALLRRSSCQRYVEFWDSDHSCGVWSMKNITILYKQIPFKVFFFNSSTAVRWNCVPRFEWSIRPLEPHLIMAPPLLSNPLFYMTVLRLASICCNVICPRSLYERSLFSFSWLRQYWTWIIWVRTLPWGLSRRRQIMHWY